ncbi:hypothetical protein CYMTET_19239 [Cymbomonas tetramitiformis]|uniref:Plastid lipid-associated protein/fibrillin conserved domain-containing protein n=1 Tax=Cymbomonas tetramitiformis TaxID=36881 RepID=A0AAE0G7S4_9CHLO|nr:hypothetical protein CYMTET_19239 [Cymbomonas tetramitiformis]
MSCLGSNIVIASGLNARPNLPRLAACSTKLRRQSSRRFVRARSSLEGGPTTISEVKQKVVKLCKDAPGNGVDASSEMRVQIAEALMPLEKQNPTAKPASEDAAALDGIWRLEYTTTQGNSAGKLGPFVGEVTQEVDISGKKYVNCVRLGTFLSLVLSADWKVLNDVTWKVIFKTLQVKMFGFVLKEIEFPPSATGLWRMSYVDSDLRILWTRGSTPKKSEGTEAGDEVELNSGESVFVLRKVAEQASWVAK